VLELAVRASCIPVSHERVATQSGPFSQNPRDCRRHATIDDFTVRNQNTGSESLISDMVVRRIMIVEKHTHRNSKEICNCWHGAGRYRLWLMLLLDSGWSLPSRVLEIQPET
jgi:hypothetical protein